MTAEKSQNSALAAKYDALYAGYAITDQPGQRAADIRLQPVSVRGWPKNLREALVFLARPGGRLLEIGCGCGEVLAALAPQFDEVVGLELSRHPAERARYGLAHFPHCTILNCPLDQLADVVAPPFDCIIWADVIEHVVDVVDAMQLLASVSRPGTQLVTVTPNVAFLPLRLRLLRGRAPTTATRFPDEGFAAIPQQTTLHDAGHLHYFTFRQVEILYRLAGFRPERRLGLAARFSRWRNLWPTLLSSSVCVSGAFVGNGP